MSILHQKNQYFKTKDKEEMIRDNERNFVEAPGISVDGPFKYMSKDQVEEVHKEITVRMEELEDSGLTRNELLYNEPDSLGI